MPRTLGWILLALLGLVLAAGVSYAASRISTQHIGLSAEPPSLGEELGPRTTRTTPSAGTRQRTPTSKQTTPSQTPAPSTTPTTPAQTTAPQTTPPRTTPTSPPSTSGGGDDHGGGSRPHDADD